MKRVLIIGSDFTPSSLPPATRIRFFATHLPKYGWEPIVLTTEPEYYDWQIDPENERLLPESLKVIRTTAWNSSWTRKFGIGDIGMRSLWNHWRAAKRICRENQIDLLLIPVPPYAPMVLGRMAHEKFGIPYVIDYIDPWVTEYYWKVPKHERPPKWPLAYWMSRLLEPIAVKKVAHVTGVSRGTTDTVIDRYEHLSITDTTEIPYGAEPNDFEYLRQHPRPNAVFDKNDGLFHLSYIGACIPGMHPTVRALFEAIRQGLSCKPDVFARMRLHFVGTSYASNGDIDARVAEIAKEYGLAEQVDERPARVSYLDSLQLMLDSSALFLVGSDEPHYTASKVFPYLLAQRPLLAIFHEASTVIRVVDANPSCFSVGFSATNPPADHTSQIREALLQMVHEGQSSDASQILQSGSNSAFSMAGRLAVAFDKAVARKTSRHTGERLSAT